MQREVWRLVTTLLSFRDSMKSFYNRYDYIFTPIAKFILALYIFYYCNAHYGYMTALNNTLLIVGISIVSAFLPVEFIAFVGGVLILGHSFKAALDVGIVFFALLLIYVFGYGKFVPKSSIIVLLVPICYSLHLIYALPIILGFLVGPMAIIPMMFGVALYQYENMLSELVSVLATATEESESVAGYQYIITGFIQNRSMLFAMCVFAIVILITYLIYKASFSYSWHVGFGVGALSNVVMFLLGSVIQVTEVGIVSVLLGSVVGVLIAESIQLFKGVLDYQRTELLQIEDEEYFYYVKAIPKLSVAESNKNVKHINTKMRR